VIAHAEDDTPRLVYADWLDENGDPDRAAFIRTQVALWDKNPSDADYRDCVESLEEACSFLPHSRSLAPSLPAGFRFDEILHSTLDSGSGGYRRGFPHLVELDYNYEPEFSEKLHAGCPALLDTTLRGICVYTVLPHEGVQSVLASEFGESLTSFLSYNQESAPGTSHGTVQTLLSSACASKLTWLETWQDSVR